jgi:HEAT repeat protein
MPLTKRKTVNVAEAVEQPQQPAGRDELIMQLSHPTPDMRRQAARELVAHPDAIPHLCARLPQEPTPAVRESILLTLMQLNSEEAARGLLPLLRSEDAGLRNSVVEALQQMPDAVAPYMETLLHDTNSDVRIFAVDVLQMLRHPHSPEWLSRIIAEDQHVNVCATAVDRLAEIGTPDMIPALEALAARFPDEPFMAFAVVTAIERITGGSAA